MEDGQQKSGGRKRYVSREVLEKSLEEMYQRFQELEQCRIEYRGVQARYEKLLQSAPDAMVFVDREAKIVLCNAQLGCLFGYSDDELIGRYLDDIIPERFRGGHRMNVDTYFAQPRVRLMGSGLEIYGMRKDGSEFPADISLSPLETEDGIVAVGAVRDISERKRADEEKQRLQEQLAQAEKLSALGRIAANVADEIRNPLTAVGGFARRLQKLADSEKEREYAQYIIEEVSRLEDILRGVLAYSRTRSPLLQNEDLRVLLDEALTVWEERFRALSITVLKSYGSRTIVRVDRKLLVEAIERIIANAADAMPTGGTLTVTLDRETAGGVVYARVRVQDTGAGIPPGRLGKIFEPFFTTKTSPKAAGLGLSIAKSIVEDEGGMIRVESEEGSGTTVSLLFPYLQTS